MPYKMWINGTYTVGISGNFIEVRNPATEEIIETAPAANAVDVEQAVSAAQAAFPAWKKPVCSPWKAANRSSRIRMRWAGLLHVFTTTPRSGATVADE